MDFTKVKVKLQMWNIPEHCKTIALGKKIAEKIGKVEDCELFSMGPGKETFIKATVDMDIKAPIKRGIMMGRKRMNQYGWISENSSKDCTKGLQKNTEEPGQQEDAAGEGEEIVQIEEEMAEIDTIRKGTDTKRKEKINTGKTQEQDNNQGSREKEVKGLPDERTKNLAAGGVNEPQAGDQNRKQEEQKQVEPSRRWKRMARGIQIGGNEAESADFGKRKKTEANDKHLDQIQSATKKQHKEPNQGMAEAAKQPCQAQ
ncbi:hypothetical protein PIB30_073104 [Stylosanthes scabra]|uniref:Uncharacterized protein n=1 Tax=Stylosanthes scabra TaxID=79078 RepID=A0ABU6TQS9_9FABA|nr:hypothetical protein [Stylosanthes scabra]